MDDAYQIDESLSMAYAGHSTKERSNNRWKYIVACVIIVLLLLLLISVVFLIFVYVKHENNNIENMKVKAGDSNGVVNCTKDNCSADGSKESKASESVCYTENCKSIAAYLNRTMNMSADPCHNFYEYSCGKWPQVHPLLPSLSKLDAITLLKLRNRRILQKVIESEVATIPKSVLTVSQGFKAKILRYYKSCVNLKEIDSIGKKAFIKMISEMGMWSPINSLGEQLNVNKSITEMLIDVHKYFTMSVYDDRITSPLFSTFVTQSSRNSSKHILEVSKAVSKLLFLILILINV